jgi:AcrR family transcriptional regulator
MSTTAAPPPASDRRKARAETSRRKLLEAALEQFALRPYGEVAASDITEAAGVADGLLFHHFDTKLGIYKAALAEAVAGLNAACAVDENAALGAQIRELLTRFLTYLAENRSLALNVILNRGGQADAIEAVEATRWDMISWAAEKLGLDDTNPTMFTMWQTYGAATDEVATRWLRADRPYPVAAMVEALIELLIGSLRGAAALDPALKVDRAVAALHHGRTRANGR